MCSPVGSGSMGEEELREIREGCVQECSQMVRREMYRGIAWVQEDTTCSKYGLHHPCSVEGSKKRDSTANSTVCSHLFGRYYAATKAIPIYWKGWNRSKGAKEAYWCGNMGGCSANNWRSLSCFHYGTQHFCKRWREHRTLCTT